jgi:hypothetical protein
MPATVAEAFAAVDLGHDDIVPVRWGTKPTTSNSGVYIVSLTNSLDSCDGKLSEPPFAEIEFRRWLDVCPNMTLDGMQPSVGQLIDRISRFWIPDEVILYIGKATELSSRLPAYYRTSIGKRSPHSGGFFLKLLSNLDRLWVHYAECDDPESAENKMLLRFCENVSPDSRRTLHDPAHPFPFANLECPKGIFKVHGLRAARERRV